jgi:hypothetical protein
MENITNIQFVTICVMVCVFTPLAVGYVAHKTFNPKQ